MLAAETSKPTQYTQAPDLYNFPSPPSKHHEPTLLPSRSPNETAAQTFRYHKSMSTSPALSLCPVQPDCGLGSSAYVRVSKSTTSLPKFSSQFGAPLQLSEFPMPDEPAPKSGKRATHVRAAKSHHNLLKRDEGSKSFFQSIFALDTRGEPLPDAADIPSPTDTGSYESDAGKSSGTITLVSHTHGPSTSSSLAQKEKKASLPYETPDPEGNPKSFPTPHPHKLSNIEPAAAAASGGSNDGYRRNSMLISPSALSAATGQPAGSSQRHPSHSRPQQKRDQAHLDVQLEKSTYRASRYLYDVPTSIPGSSSPSQHSRGSGFSWSQRISQSAPRRINRISKSLFDQHKIYDIYEESIWHTTHTTSYSTTPNMEPANVADEEPIAHMAADDGSAAVNRESSASTNNGGIPGFGSLCIGKSPRSPWRLIKSLKPHSVPRRKDTDWECSSLFSSSDYSDTDTEASLGDMRRQSARRPGSTKQGVHLIVKRAGLKLLRRSVSFCKSMSGPRSPAGVPTAESSPCGSLISERPRSAAPGKKQPRGRRLATAVRQAGQAIKGSLMLGASGGRSWGHLAVDSKHTPRAAANTTYHADTLHQDSGDWDEPSSILHSPVMPVPANSGASSRETFASSVHLANEDAGNEYAAAEDNSSRYFLPKRPPFLGLRRGSAAAAAERGSGGDMSVGVDEHNVFAGSYPSSLRASSNLSQVGDSDIVPIHARVRTVPFSSPFTTLPYGSYAQMKQQQQLQQHPNA
ncbi:hypothetical protein GQ54DRAFT_319128 [Martensiomyces pterosporus]|nr:hypothetical protein GQ54DRAFT_319128 [Martensiomyces pterosporus]